MILTKSDTIDQIRLVLREPHISFPPKSQRIGATVVRWEQIDPGVAFIHAEGGTSDDRRFAEQMVKERLAAFGIERAQFDLDWIREAATHTASWDEIMAKAKRLIQSNQVTVLRNGFNNVVGYVIGDHGEYKTEFGRDDPNSRAITTWQCDCPWDQYAWGRTRKWKKYEGRPCAHVLTLYWKSLATPLDDDVTDEQKAQMGTGQKMGPSGPPPEGEPLPSIGPQKFAPEGPIPAQQPSLFPGEAPVDLPQGPTQQAPLAPPGESGILPPAPMEQMQQMLQPPIPGTSPAGMPAPPGAVSVPGARPPSPFNPIQYPGGTYSTEYESMPEDPGATRECPECGTHMYSHDDGCSACGFMRDRTDPRWVSPHDVVSDMEARNQEYGTPRRQSSKPEAPPNYRKGSEKKQCGNCKMFNDGRCWGYGNTEVESDHVCDSWAPETKESRLAAQQFEPPMSIRSTKPIFGLAEGKSEEHGAGQYREVEEGKPGEVLGQDPSTGWIEVIFSIDDAGPLEPTLVRCFVEPGDIEETRMRNQSPWVRRR